jgi:16S rRNA (adenine1518-N6/adenine1519-N6)-dimethyltransferase
MTFVKPKKHFGQHFLKDQNIAKNIVDSLSYSNLYNKIVEVGPGTGVLTKFLLKKNEFETWVVELDRESVASLKADFPELGDRIIEGDFLKFNPENYFHGNFAVIGNFPYNISSQILFRVLDFKDQVPEVVGMFQKEVAQRIASPPGSREYGILSVLLKVWYDIDFLFTVPPEVFVPPPKVQSAVISLRRNKVTDLGCDAVLFKQVVKAGFNQRRKTLRNALKSLSGTEGLFSDEIFGKRAEQLGVEEFIGITLMLQKEK